ncbi:MAG: tetratricopeptide repeat protein [Bacteroidales bacterium]
MVRPNYFMSILLFILLIACGGQQHKKSEKELDNLLESFNKGEYKKAVYYADKLINKDSSDYLSLVIKGRALANLGKEHQGIEAISKAIEINPNYYQAYAYRAVLWVRLGNCDVHRVVQDLDIALSEEPSNVKLIRIKADCLYRLGLLTEAIAEHDKILDLDTKDYESIVSRATINKKLGNIDLALKEYTRAIELDCRQSFAFEERAWLFMEQEQFDRAVADYNRALENMPDNEDFRQLRAYSLNNRGLAYFKLGNNDKALADINLSLEMFPANAHAYKNRALVYFDNNEDAKGRSDMEKANELGL